MKFVAFVALFCLGIQEISAKRRFSSSRSEFNRIIRQTPTTSVSPGGVGGTCGAAPVTYCCQPCDTINQGNGNQGNGNQGNGNQGNGNQGTGGQAQAPCLDGPIACPAGWNTFGPFTDHCYYLPPQPAKLGMFWDQYSYCIASEPTSYPVVINDVSEQLVGSVVVTQYALNWAALLTNGFIWLGGWATPSGWKWADNSTQTDSILMGLVHFIGNKQNGTCLGADPKTLGIWQTRPCGDLTGAVVCEMAKRRVCGPTGGMLPVSPLSLTPSSLKNLFPNAISIPFTDLGKIPLIGSWWGGDKSLIGMGADVLGNAASSLGNAASSIFGSLGG